MSLFDHHLKFVHALREAGLTVSVAEGLDAAAAISEITVADREQLRAAYAATLVKRQQHRRTFDSVFDVFFPRYGSAAATPTAGDPDDPVRDAPPPWEVDDPVRIELREELFEFLRTGDETLLAALARSAVGNFGAQAGTTPGQRSWSPRTVLDRLAPHTLMARLLDEFLAGQQPGGLAEQRARTMIEARIARFEQLVLADVRRRIAEQTSTESAARSGMRPSIDRVAFLSATKAELAELRREIQPLARRLAARLAHDQRRGRRGQLDFRRTIRSSLTTGGVPMVTHHRPRHPVKTDLVVLCDLSESVTSFAHFTLLLVYALREQFSRVRAFGFVDDVDEVTRFFAPGSDVLDSVTRLAAEADVTWLLGRTDYGRALEKFEERYGDAVGRRTSLLILGDARSNYGDPALPVLQRLAEQARHAFWLNPERRSAWNTGDSVAAKYGAIVPMYECRNLAQLGAFVRDMPLTR